MTEGSQVMGMESAARPFQVCAACQHAWPTWDAFVQDPAVRLLGLQAATGELAWNLLVFEHGCGSTVSVLARRLRYLLPELESDAPLPVLFGTSQCRGHCRSLNDLEACVASCGNVRDRALILLVQCLKKAAQPSPNR